MLQSRINIPVPGYEGGDFCKFTNLARSPSIALHNLSTRALIRPMAHLHGALTLPSASNLLPYCLCALLRLLVSNFLELVKGCMLA